MAEQVIGVTDYPLVGSIESTIRMGATAGYIANADLATNLATILANIETRSANVHVTQRPRVDALKAAISVGFAQLGATPFTGGALSDIYTAIPETWGEGYSLAL